MGSNRIAIPNPGSPEAVEQGCTCPVEINCYGFGMCNGALLNGDKPIFTWHEECPVHGVGTDAMTTIEHH